MNYELETVRAQRNAAQDAIATLNQQLHDAFERITELEKQLADAASAENTVSAGSAASKDGASDKVNRSRS